MTNAEIAAQLEDLRASLWDFVAEDPGDPDDETATNVLEPLDEILVALGERES